MHCLLRQGRLLGPLWSRTSAAPSYLSDELDDIDHSAAFPSSPMEGTKVFRSTPTPNRGPTGRRTSASSEDATNPLTSILTSYVKRWPSSSKTDSGPSSRVTGSDTSTELMLSPAALKEERDRKPRLLCDPTWPWGWPPLNECTLPHTPPEAMQFRSSPAQDPLLRPPC